MNPKHLLPACLLLATGLAALPAQAQILQADFNNNVFDDNVSMGGPGLWLAIKTTAVTTGVALRAEIWTGEQQGINSIDLWSHDPVGNRPLARLGGGSWSMGRTNGWQGAPLDTPVILLTNEEFWIVWAPINGAQSSVQGTGAGAQPYRGSFNGGASWNGPFQSLQWKFRIWTGTPGHYETYGSGCIGNRSIPVLGWFGMPMVGGSFRWTLERGPANSFALLGFGESDTMSGSTPLPYSLASLGAPGCSVQASPLVTLLSPTDPAGAATLTATLPNTPAAIGFQIFNQWFCFDATANALGMTVSNAGKGTIGF